MTSPRGHEKKMFAEFSIFPAKSLLNHASHRITNPQSFVGCNPRCERNGYGE